MKNYIRFSALFLLIIGIVISCKNKNFDGHVGPSICATDNFQYVQNPKVSSGSVNLNVSPVVFTAKFNEEVPWKITITGQTTGSFKKFSGYGKAINVSWVGNPDTLLFFAAEACKVEFKIACKDPVIRNFTINTVNSFKNFDYLAYDADGNGYGTGPFTYGGQAGPPTITVTHTTPALGSPQGGLCRCLNGTASAPVWYFGGFDIPVTPSGLNSDPSTVYFNCFVNVKGSQLTIPVLTIKEGVASRSKNIAVYGNGWHYISFKLSDIGVVNPANINTISFTLNSYPTQYTSGDMCVDFVTFTNDAPFVGSTE
jgi:hypothetical protein